jgi:hypothetical protein
MTRLAAALALALLGCSTEGGAPSKPTGAPSDPVAVCERLADVCKLDGSRLGVCTASDPAAPACQGRSPCFVCMPQH